MLPFTRPTSFSLLEFQHGAFREQKHSRPWRIRLHCWLYNFVSEWFFRLFVWVEQRGGYIQIMIVRSWCRATACYFHDMLLFLGGLFFLTKIQLEFTRNVFNLWFLSIVVTCSPACLMVQPVLTYRWLRKFAFHGFFRIKSRGNILPRKRSSGSSPSWVYLFVCFFVLPLFFIFLLLLGFRYRSQFSRAAILPKMHCKKITLCSSFSCSLKSKCHEKIAICFTFYTWKSTCLEGSLARNGRNWLIGKTQSIGNTFRSPNIRDQMDHSQYTI